MRFSSDMQRRAAFANMMSCDPKFARSFRSGKAARELEAVMNAVGEKKVPELEHGVSLGSYCDPVRAKECVEGDMVVYTDFEDRKTKKYDTAFSMDDDIEFVSSIYKGIPDTVSRYDFLQGVVLYGNDEQRRWALEKLTEMKNATVDEQEEDDSMELALNLEKDYLENNIKQMEAKRRAIKEMKEE